MAPPRPRPAPTCTKETTLRDCWQIVPTAAQTLRERKATRKQPHLRQDTLNEIEQMLHTRTSITGFAAVFGSIEKNTPHFFNRL
jgi:hypothetical protein